MIASELDFWQEWEQPNISQELSILDLHPLVQARRIRNLLLDDALARRLHRQSAWRFSSIDVFYAIVTGVPEVFQHTNWLKFENFADGLGTAVGRLDMFSSLTGLNISVPPPMEEVDLGMIAASCPLLNCLSIRDLRDYRGSLEHAGNLENLRIQFYQHEAFQALLLPNLIPTRSAGTLRGFDIKFGLFDDDNFDLLALTTFLNLKTLATHPLIPQLCNLIRHGGFTLINLEIEFSQPIPGLGLADLLAILSAPCVRFLQVLKFKLDSDRDDRLTHTDEEEWTDAIISEMLKLQYLSCLVLVMGLRMTWCERFAALKNLTILHYGYFHYDDLGLESPITETFEQIAKESQTRVGNHFDEAFAGFVSKPFVSLHMRRYHM
jgi:hypothetical protein